ncbi:hypothetical protein THRCLA_20554 [Thraustotheca clavata]|uniref:Uncharacterized protein n=1 Tax=Thraustotheca clavata TaxID=74557 RepID=A0A1W0A5Z4_9STRA|nr:hypothetical protein THRCLA_20554 [Thraustotheca clavata]
MDKAAEFGRFDIVKYILENRTEDVLCQPWIRLLPMATLTSSNNGDVVVAALSKHWFLTEAIDSSS